MSEENRTKCNAALASLTEHLKSIDTACEDARLSAVEKIRRKEEIDKAQICLRTMTNALEASLPLRDRLYHKYPA
jgi:hypothetical protein